MKFLILAVCVCAANAASLSIFNTQSATSKTADALSTAGNILVTPAVAAANVATSLDEAASKTSASPANKVVATPAITDAEVVATSDVTAAKVESTPAVTVAKAVATPAVSAAEVDATPAVTAFKVVATPAVVDTKTNAPVVAVTKVVATPAVEAAKVAAVPVVAEARAAPAAFSNANADAGTSIVRDINNVRPDGYTFGYETDSGIVVESTGTLKNVNGTDALVIEGSYEYIAADGSKVKVTYVADENGFRAESESLPVAPPTPQVILDALQYIATHPKWVDPSMKK